MQLVVKAAAALRDAENRTATGLLALAGVSTVSTEALMGMSDAERVAARDKVYARCETRCVFAEPNRGETIIRVATHTHQSKHDQDSIIVFSLSSSVILLSPLFVRLCLNAPFFASSARCPDHCVARGRAAVG